MLIQPMPIRPLSVPRHAPIALLRAVACAIVLSLGALRPGFAADAPSGVANLTGFADATLGVSQLTADGAQCGLQLDRVGEAAHRLIADSGIQLRDDADNRVTISAITTRVGPTDCATAVMLGVYAKESFFSATAGWVQSGYVVLWQRSLMVATPIGQHAASVIDAARQLSHQMLLDWRAQNPLPATSSMHPTTPSSADTNRVAAQMAPPADKATQ